MASIITKQASIEDLDAIAVLFNEYRIFYDQPSDLEGARQYLFDRLVSRESIIFIALENNSNRPIGFTQLYPSFSSISMRRSLILNDLYVQNSFRKNGAGRMLLDAAKTYAIQTQVKGLELSTAMTNNAAQKLYECYGYQKDEEFYHYYLSL